MELAIQEARLDAELAADDVAYVTAAEVETGRVEHTRLAVLQARAGTGTGDERSQRAQEAAVRHLQEQLGAARHMIRDTRRAATEAAATRRARQRV